MIAFSKILFLFFVYIHNYLRTFGSSESPSLIYISYSSVAFVLFGIACVQKCLVSYVRAVSLSHELYIIRTRIDLALYLFRMSCQQSIIWIHINVSQLIYQPIKGTIPVPSNNLQHIQIWWKNTLSKIDKNLFKLTFLWKTCINPKWPPSGILQPDTTTFIINCQHQLTWLVNCKVNCDEKRRCYKENEKAVSFWPEVFETKSRSNGISFRISRFVFLACS